MTICGDTIKKNISDNIIRFRENAGMTQKELANRLGVTPSRISNWEQGANCPTIDILFEVCKVLNVSINDIYGVYPDTNVTLTFSEMNHLKKYRLLDSYGQETIDMMIDREVRRVTALKEKEEQIIELNKASLPRYVVTYYQRMASAGKGMFLFDDIPTDLIEVPDTPVAHMADFVIGVIGDSMEPTYHDGDKVFVKKLDEMPTGNIGIFIKGNDCFIKELGVDRLISHNKDYSDIPASEDIRLVGKVLGKVDELDL